jgi:hypothetical protein
VRPDLGERRAGVGAMQQGEPDEMNMALAGLVVLLIGDSHIAATGYFNDPLHDALLQQGASVNSFGVCGASAADWIAPIPITCGRGERHGTEPAQVRTSHSLRGWSLPHLIDEYKPNLVVIELGDTMAGYGTTSELPRTLIFNQVQELLIPIKARDLPCVWIGPPWGTDGGPYKKTNARVKELSDYLSQIVSPCAYIDSLSFSQPDQWTTRDGVHLTGAAADRWDNDVVRSLEHITAGLHRHEPRR